MRFHLVVLFTTPGKNAPQMQAVLSSGMKFVILILAISWLAVTKLRHFLPLIK